MGNLTYVYLVPRQTAGRNDFTKPLQFVSMTGTLPATVSTFRLFSEPAGQDPVALTLTDALLALAAGQRVERAAF